jgi:hypothetical protein
MTDKKPNRRSFIKGVTAGLAGAFLAFRGAAPVEAASLQVPRTLRHIVGSDGEGRGADTRAVIAEARPRKGTTEMWWIRMRHDADVYSWRLIEVGRAPDGDGIVNWDIAYWRESEL